MMHRKIVFFIVFACGFVGVVYSSQNTVIVFEPGHDGPLSINVTHHGYVNSSEWVWDQGHKIAPKTVCRANSEGYYSKGYSCSILGNNSLLQVYQPSYKDTGRYTSYTSIEDHDEQIVYVRAVGDAVCSCELNPIICAVYESRQWRHHDMMAVFNNGDELQCAMNITSNVVNGTTVNKALCFISSTTHSLTDLKGFNMKYELNGVLVSVSRSFKRQRCHVEKSGSRDNVIPVPEFDDRVNKEFKEEKEGVNWLHICRWIFGLVCIFGLPGLILIFVCKKNKERLKWYYKSSESQTVHYAYPLPETIVHLCQPSPRIKIDLDQYDKGSEFLMDSKPHPSLLRDDVEPASLSSQMFNNDCGGQPVVLESIVPEQLFSTPEVQQDSTMKTDGQNACIVVEIHASAADRDDSGIISIEPDDLALPHSTIPTNECETIAHDVKNNTKTLAESINDETTNIEDSFSENVLNCESDLVSDGHVLTEERKTSHYLVPSNAAVLDKKAESNTRIKKLSLGSDVSGSNEEMKSLLSSHDLATVQLAVRDEKGVLKNRIKNPDGSLDLGSDDSTFIDEAEQIPLIESGILHQQQADRTLKKPYEVSRRTRFKTTPIDQLSSATASLYDND